MSYGDTVGSGIDVQLAESRLWVLIVGAGIAGATLASLLRRRGEPAALIERASESADAGYMLGIAPLADELSRADSDHLSYALELYEKRQRSRVERLQKNSRRLSRLMFVNCHGALEKGPPMGASGPF